MNLGDFFELFVKSERIEVVVSKESEFWNKNLYFNTYCSMLLF